MMTIARRLLAFTLLLTLAACGGRTAAPLLPVPSASPTQLSVVPCSQIQDLRALGATLTHVTNAKTGDSMEYVVIGDGAVSSDILVMFPGTGQILTGWPVQMLTNSVYSPQIKNSIAYDPLEDGAISLCHNYRIALFDYPGVGGTPLPGNVTRDMISNDVDAMLTDATSKYGIATNVVDPVGWSLGTANALKYAMLASAGNPARSMHNVILVAAGPGGSTQAQVGNDTASCVTTMFSSLLTATGSLSDQLKTNLTEMIFPYIGQTQGQSGTTSGCTATVTSTAVTLSITPDCGVLNHCLDYLAGSIVDLNTYPWSLTKGIDQSNYIQERELSNDFDVAYCSGAGSNFTSTGCIAFGTVAMSVQNGGMCKTDTSNPNVPVSTSCAPITMSGKMTVINGYEDLLTQWTYGQALISGYAANGTKTSLQTYAGAAGHGVMVQHPGWVQAQMYAAMQ